MECSYSLLNLVPGNVENGDPQTGGTWTLTAAEIPVGTPVTNVTLNVNGVDESISINNAVPPSGAAGSKDNPTLVFDDTASGVFEFTYTVTGGAACSDTAVLTITVIEGAMAGQSVSVTKCDSDDTDYFLFSMLEDGVAPNGGGNWTQPPANDGTVTAPGPGITAAWTGNTGSPGYTAGADPTQAIFNPSAHGSAGDVNFTYTVTKDSGDAACTNCTANSTITFTITGTPYAGEDETFTVCNDPLA